MRVFLTGGTGLLGSHLAEELRSRGHGVVALHRPTADTAFLESLDCTLVPGDVTDPADVLAEAMSGCSHVVHGAALVYSGGVWETIRAVNVEGTRAVLEGAAAAGVDHVLHVSSVAVYGTVAGEIDESAPLDAALPAGDLYARSKRLAEAEARAVETERGLPLTIVRPSAVYGERDRLMVPALADILRRPIVPVFGPGDNTLPVVYAGNVASAMRRMLEAGGGGEDATYDVGLDHPLTQRCLFEGLAAGLGRSPSLVRVPATAVRGTVRLLVRLGVRTPGAQHLPLDRVARLALGENPYPSRRVRDVLGWEPQHRHEDALARTGRWYLSAH
jgi:nucleoside-diphosphate-sugar epimerase